jgi:hypothetical protein
VFSDISAFVAPFDRCAAAVLPTDFQAALRRRYSHHALTGSMTPIPRRLGATAPSSAAGRRDFVVDREKVQP